MLTLLFPDRVKYAEGKTNTGFFGIDHAFNRVGDKYVDITFEFALKDEPTGYEYVVFGEYDLDTINRISDKTGYYGDYYRALYIERLKDTPGNP